MLPEFKVTPFTDFSKEENIKKVEQAITHVESKLGQEYSLVIGGKRFKCPDQFFSHNPSQPEQVIGIFQKGTPEMAEKAINVALETFKTWKNIPAEKRAEYCFKIAEKMRERKSELTAWMILEVGKSWVEADADVAEAIDLVDFYGREVLRYAEPHPLLRIPTEENEQWYIPLGVGIIIPPWNFPLAILAGMTTAAFASGNTVVLKPSSDSPGIAKKYMELVEEVGVPPGVVNLITGPGSLVGEVLVKHPKTRFISFTGSKEVGLRINEMASRIETGQIWIKRVIAEMGGKNAIIVDSEAELDAAATGVMASAFGYQGQKCSACSRVVVVAEVHDKFLEKLVEKTKQIKVGSVKLRENYMGPVINMKAMASILDYVEMGKREGKLLLGGNRIGNNGYFIAPTIITDIDQKATIAQEEIFGPVLAIIKAKDFDDALDIVNDSIYGLTGSVYTTNRKKIEKAKAEFHVGNLYINRKSTGALVGVHPFGGFNMSGTDSKAGGRDYLLLYTQAKAISEVVKR